MWRLRCVWVCVTCYCVCWRTLVRTLPMQALTVKRLTWPYSPPIMWYISIWWKHMSNAHRALITIKKYWLAGFRLSWISSVKKRHLVLGLDIEGILVFSIQSYNSYAGLIVWILSCVMLLQLSLPWCYMFHKRLFKILNNYCYYVYIYTYSMYIYTISLFICILYKDRKVVEERKCS